MRKIGSILFALAAIGAAGALAGCAMDSHADSSGNFGPGGSTPEANDDSVPDCYDNTGQGEGQFGGWKKQGQSNYAAEADGGVIAPGAVPFDALLGRAERAGQSASAPDPDLLLGWGGGGGDGSERRKRKPC